ncbi:eukaryotic translation initiation factor 4G [Rhodamnia argentea]|uniref:Eukaryotic translation initiation factor 4G n=1 Tax=Rhodamnia argentea TaxID=178133 RepID=A0ABM3H8K0_9MYRT|nr:eukaryotic translation initiation factor 4G [Rhodamnia argentea]
MSFNQSRYQKSEAAQDRRPGRSAGFNQQRTSSGGYSKGGGAPAPSPSISSNRSFKKSNNVQGGQSRVNLRPVNISSEPAGATPTQHNLQNGAHVQPQPQSQGQSDAGKASATAKPAETPPAANRNTRAVPKAPTSQPPTMSSEMLPPSTPQKAPGDASKAFSFQFGSLSPGLMNGMQIPARTSSAPPNLDEQKRDQARHDAIKAGPQVPVPAAPKHPLPKRDLGATDQSNAGDSHTVSKGKKDQVPPIPPSVQSQKPPAHAMPGISMQMPFNQPQVPIQFNGPNTSIQSQGMASTSLQLPIPMSMLPVGNAPPSMQQQMYVTGLQAAHMIQPQGIMHQSQGLSFGPQINPQFPSQLGTLGMGISPYSQQQGAKFVGPRKTAVKITHPETHQEVRLDKRTEGFSDGGPSSRSHSNVPPQAQHISSYPSNHPANYFTNSYGPSPLFFPAPSSLPLSGTQITPTSQAPRFNPPVNQGAQRMTLLNSQDNSQLPERAGISIRAAVEPPPKQDQMQNAHAPPSALVQGTSKPRIVSDGENITDLPSASVLTAFEKVESPKAVKISGNSASRDSEVSGGPLLKEPGSDLGALPGPNKQYVGSTGASGEQSVTSSTANRSSAEAASTNVAGRRMENLSRSNSIKNHEQRKKGDDPHSIKVTEEGNSNSAIALRESSHSGVLENLKAKTTITYPSGICDDVPESVSESFSTTDAFSPDILEVKHDGAGEGIVSVSSEISAGEQFLDNSQTCQQSIQDDSAEKNEILDYTNADGGELESTEPVEQPKESVDSSVVSSVSVSLEHSDIIREGDQDSVPLVEASGEDVPTSTTERTSLDEERNHRDTDMTMGNSEMPTSSSLDSNIGEATPCDAVPLASVDGDNSQADASVNGRDEVIDSSSVLMSDSLKAGAGDDGDGDVTESVEGSLKSVQTAVPKDRPAPEISRSSSNIARGKKKRKEVLQRADAAGATLDLYMAYKGPEEKKESVESSRGAEIASEDIHVNQAAAETSTKEAVVSDDVEQTKAEIDDWEDAADVSSPALEPSTSRQQVDVFVPSSENRNGFLARKYSRDFLLKFAERCTNLPENFEVTDDIAEVFNPFVNGSRFADRDSHPSPGRTIDRQSGGARVVRRGSGLADDDKWGRLSGAFGPGRDLRLDVGLGPNPGLRPGQGGNYGVLRNPRAQASVQYTGGILSGPMQSPGFQGGMQRNNSDSDRWQRATGFQQKGLIPSPQTPLQMMHRAEKKYEVGRVTDEEQAKQRQLKAILNKLTPQNFEKLFEQVKAVNIDNAPTLKGLISQIFDKALMEPTFCEMYANLCRHLAQELPDFIEDDNKITFRRVLLNKCQEEFERGEREEEEANKAEEEGEIKQSEEEREEKRIKARRRMLGNIRLIGELYKKRMLTEKIMHECIKKLLGGQHETPEEEDIEALCKLMSTIGEMIDHPKAKDHMDTYFEGMWNLSNNMNLSSRVRFMLKDSIDLRRNKWQQRRKVEGPKKIDEVHRDAAQERHAQVSRNARAPGINSSRRGQPVDFSSRGSSVLSSPNAQVSVFRGLQSQVRGQGSQDIRFEERQPHESRPLAVPLPQRLGGDSHSITLGPQGGLGRGMSFRGPPSMSSTSVGDISSGLLDSRRIADASNGVSSVEKTSYVADRLSGSGAYDHSGVHRNRPGSREGFDRSGGNSPSPRMQGTSSSQDISSEKARPEERLRDMSIAAIKEFYSAKDEKEISLCIKDLNSPSFYPSMISLWVSDSFERKDLERDLLAKLLTNLTRSQECMLSPVDLIQGFESVLTTLEDAVNDAPKAAEFLGHIFGKIIVENIIPLRDIGHLIREGGGEPGQLLEVGLAADVLGSTLEVIKSEKGETVFNEIRSSSNLRLEDFRPPGRISSRILDRFV